MAEDDESTAQAGAEEAGSELVPYSAAAAIATGLVTLWALFAHVASG